MFLLVSHRPAQLLPTIRSRCVALAVPVPPQTAPCAGWQSRAHGTQSAGSPTPAAPRFARSTTPPTRILERLLQRPMPVDDRDQLEAFADALQKIALDRALGALGLPPKYQTGTIEPNPVKAREWLSFARGMVERRLLSRHPLNPKLFSAEMLGNLPSK